MNKEEILNTFLLANIPEIITQEEFNDVKKAIKELLQENKQLKEKVNKLEILIESLYLGVTLNQEEEDLLDKVLFGGDSNEKI